MGITNPYTMAVYELDNAVLVARILLKEGVCFMSSKGDRNPNAGIEFVFTVHQNDGGFLQQAVTACYV